MGKCAKQYQLIFVLPEYFKMSNPYGNLPIYQKLSFCHEQLTALKTLEKSVDAVYAVCVKWQNLGE